MALTDVEQAVRFKLGQLGEQSAPYLCLQLEWYELPSVLFALRQLVRAGFVEQGADDSGLLYSLTALGRELVDS